MGEEKLISKIMHRFGIDRKTAEAEYNKYLKLNRQNTDDPKSEPKVKQTEITSNGYTHTFISPHDIRDEATMAKICKINTKLWYADKIVSNTWGSDDNPCWQFKVWWKRRDKPTPQDACEAYVQYCKGLNLKPYTFEMPKVNMDKGELMLEVAIADPHIGLLSWSPETCGNNYDLKIACKRFLETQAYFLESFRNAGLSKVLLVIGNDFFNSNNAKNTTANDTAQDEDCRWQKTYMAGMDVVVKTINMWIYGLKIPIEVEFVHGNHDEERLFYLGHNIKTLFSNNPQVTVMNSPNPHKFYTFGDNLILFAHELRKPETAKDILLADGRSYTNAKNIEVHTGHFHNEKVVESLGRITLRSLPSLAEPSRWESSQGYRSLKKALAFLWHEKHGVIDIRPKDF